MFRAVQNIARSGQPLLESLARVIERRVQVILSVIHAQRRNFYNKNWTRFMWSQLTLRKRITLAAIPLVLAIGLTISREVITHLRSDSRQVQTAQFHHLMSLGTLRMSRKFDELRRKGVKQPELKKLLDQEQEQTRLEANKVMASHYQKPFNMNSYDTETPDNETPRQ